MPPLHETIQDFPSGVRIAGVTIGKRDVVGVTTSPWSRRRGVQVFPGQQWELSMRFLPMKRDEAGILEAFILSLRGQAGRFRMGDTYQSQPRGRALGKPVVAAAVAGDEELTVSGWAANVAGQLEPNDRIQIGDHLYAVIERIDSAAAGTSSLRVWPALREGYAVGTEIVTRNARGVFALVNNQHSFSRSTVELYGTTIQAVEVV